MVEHKSARQVAFEILERIEYHGAYANIAVNQALRGAVTKQDRAFITELVYGTVRMRLALKWVLEKFLVKPWHKLDPEIRLILMLGAYQLLYMDKVPARAAVNEMVNLAKKVSNRGAAGFVNGVLRNVIRNLDQISWPCKERDPVAYLSVVYSHPRWLVERWLERFGFEETEALCRYNNSPAPTTARVNTLKTTGAALIQQLAEEDVETSPGKLMPEAVVIKSEKPLAELAAYKQGMFTLQDESSMLPARVLAARPGSLVVDGCAAPGGKATHIAQLMNNEGRIIACDVHEHKISLIKQNKERLGCSIIQERMLDARELGRVYRQQVDYLLLDVPCTGLGVLSRRADARWRKNREDIKEMTRLQWEILTKAVPCLKPNGVLVYSTCTLTQEENEDMISAFLKQFPEFVMDDLTPYIPFKLLDKDITTARNGYLQLLPQHYGVDGFFVARIKRRGDS
ncbi:MAG: 16S rRNA (cytosine(967)-C(5))-methyltransferase RsmB [Thermoanaerobacteraceae bacterium]|nr:16S rRNA (cytosine(967)-C(5))-methyltransferase RsmB [Thermoanaerobacteraceae bacterium]